MEIYEPDANAGLGLIYRLNALWIRADNKALGGDLSGWELVLDRIFSNLLYREDIESVTDEDGKLLDLTISEDNYSIWKKIKNNIKEKKKNIYIAMLNRKIDKIYFAKEEHYHSIMFYDIWVRKLMQQLKLYMKEGESNPSQALFGRTIKKR